MRTNSQFKSNLNGKLHGTTLNKIDGVNAKIGDAAAAMSLRTDPPTTIRSSRIENAIYDHVFNYTIPSDFKGVDSVIDIRPIGVRSTDDGLTGRGLMEFDVKKERNTFAVEQVNGVKTLRLSKNLTGRTTVAPLDSAADPFATIALSGDASDLTTDNLDFVSGSGSISFDLSGSTGQAIVTITLADGIDLSDLLNLGALMEWIKFPAATLTSVALRWGSSASAYWQKSVTKPHDRTAFDNNAWNLLIHDWNSATKVGSPDEAAISVIQIVINYTAGTAVTGVHLDSVTAALGEAWEMVYYSNAFFTNAAGTVYKTEPTLETDLILLDPDALNILSYETLAILAQEVKGKNGSSDVELAYTRLEGKGNTLGLYDHYNEKYPSQAIRLQGTYYEFGELSGL
jgi:hypothetical protein